MSLNALTTALTQCTASTDASKQGEDVSLGIWIDESPLKDFVQWKAGHRRMVNNGDCKSAKSFGKYLIGETETYM